MAQAQVIGVYPVPEAEQQCHLVELVVSDYIGKLDVGTFTQPLADYDRSHWQVPYWEHVLSADGNSGQLAALLEPLQVNGTMRLAFFFHHLQHRPLVSQFGLLSLPPESNRPSRLAFIEYEPPN